MIEPCPVLVMAGPFQAKPGDDEIVGGYRR